MAKPKPKLNQKPRNRSWVMLVIVMTLASAWALKIYHPDEILMMPETTRELVITVGDLDRNINTTLSCSSSLTVVCPTTINIPANGTQEALVKIRSNGAGLFPIYIKVGGFSDTLLVRVSESPQTLENLLINYYHTLVRIENRTGRTKAGAVAEGVINNAFMLYDEEKYEELSEEMENVRLHVTRAMQEPTLFPPEPEIEGEVPVALGFTFAPLVLLAALGGFAVHKKFRIHNQKHIDFSKDLNKIKSEATVVDSLRKPEEVQDGK